MDDLVKDDKGKKGGANRQSLIYALRKENNLNTGAMGRGDGDGPKDDYNKRSKSRVK